MAGRKRSTIPDETKDAILADLMTRKIRADQALHALHIGVRDAVGNGLTYREIGGRLSVSTSTVFAWGKRAA